MNDGTFKDPSDGVPLQLLKHLHLRSNYTYPAYQTIQLDTIVDWLLAAPRIVHEVQPMGWRFIDAPPDGMSMLVWQPLAKLGVESASDGYIWADAEQKFVSSVKGYVVEGYVHRTGFRYPHERVAEHSRRRYRLMPGPNPNPNAPSPDPSLWIVHYSRAEMAYHMPVERIAVSNYARATLTQRQYIQQNGQQLQRKDFMLHDRNSWPRINLPSIGTGVQAPSYPSDVISHLNRQQPGYPPPRAAPANQAANGPPPPKRPRPNSSHAPAALAGLQQEPQTAPGQEIIEAEDVSMGDLLDFLTPREISANRYKQHHDWLGEVFRSGYDTQQIIPGEIGLGRKGELEALTKEFFNAPTGTLGRTPHGVPQPHVGRLEDGKADEFTKLANARIAEINADIEKLKRQHAKRMAKLAKGRELRDAERALRTANVNALDARSNDTGGSGQLDEGDDKVAAIKSKVEAALGKEIRPVKDAECIQKGGLQDKVEDSENISQEYDFGDPVADLSEQIPAFATPQDPLSSMEHTPGLNTDPTATSNAAADAAEGAGRTEATDITMSGMQDAPQLEGNEAEDWVVVSKDGGDKDAPNEELPDLDAFTNDAAIGSGVGTPEEALETTAEDLPGFAAAEGELGADFAENDFTGTVDFGNLDTAGEALSGYGVDESMGIDDHTDLGMTDTAFGDAFHSGLTEAEQGHDTTDS